MTTKPTEGAAPADQEGRQLLLIGRREHVDFPEWGLFGARAKIDTGAYSSALDVLSYELLEDGKLARLHIAVRRRPPREMVVMAPVVGLVKVRHSGGKEETRPLIEPLIRLGPITRQVRLTLTSRARMRCRMLLGRQALAGQFLVDVRFKDLLRRWEMQHGIIDSESPSTARPSAGPGGAT
jgi:hypothetical protein